MTSNKKSKVYIRTCFLFYYYFIFYRRDWTPSWLQIRRWRCEKVYVVPVWLPYVTTVRPVTRLLFGV